MDKKISNVIFGGIELEILGLYLSDYAAKFHVREISRILDANHRTISLALKALENKGVMKHEIAGKNKQYFLNLDNFLTKEYIRNAESAKKIKLLDKYFVIKKLLAELSEDLKGTPMILFGSYSKGEEAKDSDVDILILKDGKEQKIENIIKEFAKRLKAAEMLTDKIPYSIIEKETGLSSTTVARVAKWLNGKGGGYKTIINRLHHHNSIQSRRGLS